MSAETKPQLELRQVTKRFGGVAAVDGVTFEVAKGDIVGIIGPNGAGKTTLLNCISGLYRLDGGDIRWDGASISGMAPHRVARLGIGRTFQIVRPFGSMTVRENAAIGALFGSAEARRKPKEAFEIAPRPAIRCRRSRSQTASASRLRAPWPPSRTCCCSMR